MRRTAAFRRGRDGQVAIYDALLFLMVVILISMGMFLYTATVATEGGGFSDDYYQHQADTQLTMVERLSLNETYPTPRIRWENATSNETFLLNETVGEPEVQTVQWLLMSYCELRWSNETQGDHINGTYDPQPILPLVDAYFRNNQLNGTEHAWLFLYKGENVTFGSSTNVTIDTLPDNRWTSDSDYSSYDSSGNGTTERWKAQLRYFLWYP